MEEKLNAILAETLEKIKGSADLKSLDDVRVGVLGRKGSLTLVLRSLGELAPEERGRMGKKANEVKKQIETSLDERTSAL
ncbi:MAG TPA: phenylalanine--tRNA ligase subunit alpha, partial [Spirochaetota bacterium]|nr:phenylalanine--tRNA ligase subunit alpha [Spirochaetota bacterium]